MTNVTLVDLQEIKTNKNRSLLEASKTRPVLLVFLRHFGCIFCREAMKDLSKNRSNIESRGVSIIFVHMSDESTADNYFSDYGLEEIEHISDPGCQVYSKFGLLKGSFNQLYGLQIWLRGIQTTVVEGTSFSLKQIGDGLQMPGVFYILDGVIREEYVHSRVSDRPNYLDLINCCAA